MSRKISAVLACGLVPPSGRACVVARQIFSDDPHTRIGIAFFKLTAHGYFSMPAYVPDGYGMVGFSDYCKADTFAIRYAKRDGISWGGTLASVLCGRVAHPFYSMPTITF